jgi:HSP20 family protein
MRRFGEDMDRLFEDFGFAGMQQGFAQIASVPNVEMTERDGQLIIRADLPGVKKDDVQVEIRDDRVILQGERKQEREERREGYYRSERAYGSFYREIPLPEGVNTENASANFRDGVLEITMQAPKREANGRQLQIEEAQSGGQQEAQARGAGSSR